MVYSTISIKQMQSNSNMWAAFEWEVSYLQGKGDVIIMGDLNARTGELNDWIKMDQRDNIPLPHEYTLLM